MVVSFLSRAYLESLDEAERARIYAENVPLGEHPKTGDMFFLPEKDRQAGMYVIGVQGVGESAFLETMIHHVCVVGNPVVVFDPHADLIYASLAALPTSRVKDAYLLDLEDEDWPFGITLFSVDRLETNIQRTQAVDRIFHVFDLLWPEVTGQQNLPRYLRAAIHVFLDNPNSTLVDMYDFFLDDALRQRMVANCTDQSVQTFWRHEFEELKRSPGEIARRIQPLINRLEHLFMGRSLVRNIVGQRQNTINFREAAEQRRALFIKLPINLVKEDAQLIGTLLLAQLTAAIFSFMDLPVAQRPHLSLFVDEAQLFATPDFSKLFSEGRKFGVRMTLAHQYRSQLLTFLRDSTETARTKVAFQINADDANEMGAYFPTPAAGIDPESISTTVDKALRAKTSDFPPHVRDFVHTYLIPLQGAASGGRVTVGRRPNWGFSNGPQQQEVWVEDPTDLLNGLLYQCMKEGRANLPIPWKVAIGFCTTGGGFFSAIRYPNNPKLLPGYAFPPHLVMPTEHGLMWHEGRAPETADERLIHFVFCLRQTMGYLSKHPVGKPLPTAASAVGAMLTQLPRRAAFVRSGDDVGVIYTLDTPAQLEGTLLTDRMAIIRDQTRATYCRPKQEVEQDIAKGPPPPEASSSALGAHHRRVRRRSGRAIGRRSRLTIRTTSEFSVRPIHELLLRGNSLMPYGLYHLHLATAEQLCRLHYRAGSLKAVKARLKTLAEAGFVQADTVPTKRFRAPYYYTLGPNGVKHLAQAGYDTNESWRASKEMDKHALFVEHTLELGDVLISAFLLGKLMQSASLHSFTHERVLKRRPYKATWQRGDHSETFSVIPDAFLDFHVLLDGVMRRMPVLLEHDRGTEEQYYFRRRIRAYRMLLTTGSAAQLFGAKVVTIAFTTFQGKERLAQMQAWTRAELEHETATVGQRFRFAALTPPLHPAKTWFGEQWYGLDATQPPQPLLAA